MRILLPFIGGVLLELLVGQNAEWGRKAGLLLFFLGLGFLLVALLIYILQGEGLAGKTGFLTLFILALLACGMGSAAASRFRDPLLPDGEELVLCGRVMGESYANQERRCIILHCRFVQFRDGSARRLHTRIRVYLDREVRAPERGEHWCFYGTPRPMARAVGGQGVDYRKIFGRKNCWYRIYPGPGDSRRLAASNHRAVNSYRRDLFGTVGREREGALLRAICMGDRSGLDPEMRELYATAGAMHLLAISGLHVGLVWWVLQYPAALLFRIVPKQWVRLLAVLALLWAYAALAGLGPSVVRSVSMFSFFSLARYLGRRAFSLQALLLSALLLLAIRPSWIQDVGFQLSYLAMLGILLYYPLLRKRVPVRSRLVRWLRDSLLLSFSAQLFTAALVVRYFHYFSTWSFLSSLVGIPLLSLIIFVFVLSFPLHLAGLLPAFVLDVQFFLARLMNLSMEFFAGLPAALVSDCRISIAQLASILLFFFFFASYLERRRAWPLSLAMLSLAFFLFAV